MLIVGVANWVHAIWYSYSSMKIYILAIHRSFSHETTTLYGNISQFCSSQVLGSSSSGPAAADDDDDEDFQSLCKCTVMLGTGGLHTCMDTLHCLPYHVRILYSPAKLWSSSVIWVLPFLPWLFLIALAQTAYQKELWTLRHVSQYFIYTVEV